jgi:glycosyltransferase involved in cell wall biosynthesis
MHILILPSEEYIPNHTPLAGIFQHDQARVLISNGHKVSVISYTFTFTFPILLKGLFGIKTKSTVSLKWAEIVILFFKKLFNPKKSSIAKEYIDGVCVYRCDGFWGLNGIRGDLGRLNLWRSYGVYSINRYIKENGTPDVIHAHNMVYAGLLAEFYSRKSNVPVVLTEHSSGYAMDGIQESLSYEIKKSIKQLKHVYAVSPELINLLETKFALSSNKIGWLPNVLDSEIEDSPLITNSKQGKVVFLNIANLIPLKGQKELIRSFKLAFDNTNNVELRIGGQGILKVELLDLIDDLNLTSKVKLIGYLTREGVVGELDRASVFVLPSHYETFGVVLIEALCKGVPVIATSCGGPNCIVNSSNGILVPIKNEEELAIALKEMYHTYNNYSPENLREDCIVNFGRLAFYNKLMRVYKSVVI